MQSQAKTVSQYLKEVPPERLETIKTLRQTILDNLPVGYVNHVLSQSKQRYDNQHEAYV